MTKKLVHKELNWKGWDLRWLKRIVVCTIFKWRQAPLLRLKVKQWIDHFIRGRVEMRLFWKGWYSNHLHPGSLTSCNTWTGIHYEWEVRVWELTSLHWRMWYYKTKHWPITFLFLKIKLININFNHCFVVYL